MPELLKPLDRPALRAYGLWSERPYVYSHNGTEAVAVKRFIWKCSAVAVQHDQPMELSYFADATVAAARMNELVHLADREQQAIGTLEAMVMAAINGVGYLGLPNLAIAITNDVVTLVGGWVEEGGHPDAWQMAIAQTVGAAIDRLNAWQRLLTHVGAAPDPENVGWGLAFAIKLIEPKETP